MRSAGAHVIAITNNAESPLAHAVNIVLPLEAGAECAVPATKTVTTQLLAVAFVATALGPVPFTAIDLAVLPGEVAQVLADNTSPQRLAERWSRADWLLMVARRLFVRSSVRSLPQSQGSCRSTG